MIEYGSLTERALVALVRHLMRQLAVVNVTTIERLERRYLGAQSSFALSCWF